MALYAQQTSTSWLKTDDLTDVFWDPSSDAYTAMQAWIALGNTPDPIPPARRPHIIPAAVYVDRFTAAEFQAIQNFSLTTPPTAQSNAVYNYLFRLPLIQSIDLTATATANRHAFLVTQGLLTAARSTIILTP